MDDLISRQEAIDAAKHAWAKGLEPSQYIEIIPPAQPEIIKWGQVLGIDVRDIMENG